ncbi:TPA: outer membrane beta-barrel protein [Pasteurella multocida]|nr:outer membrane beta-barrel protein [Pasteurella multocida]
MKKSVFVLALGTLCAATASANFYVQGDLGYSKLKFEDVSKSKFSPSLAVGYKFDDFRLALDYSHYGKLTHTEQESATIPNAGGGSQTVSGPEKYSLKVTSWGLSALYDFNFGTEIKPYVGMRLSQNHFKSTLDFKAPGYSEYRSTKVHKLGYGFLAGAQYALVKNVSLNAGIEYNRLGKIDGVKVNQYGAKVGLRYDF